MQEYTPMEQQNPETVSEPTAPETKPQEQAEQAVQRSAPFPAAATAPVKASPHQSTGRELIAVLLSYVLGFLYIEGILCYINDFTRVLFCAAFTASGLVYFRDRLRTKEHWIWLGCLWICLLADLFGRNQVWEYDFMLFVHTFAIYWIMTLSGKLIEGTSSAYLPMDALNGAVILPFARFFTVFRIQTLNWGIQSLKKRKKVNFSAIIFGALAVAISVVLLIGAGSLLTQADANFGTFLENILPKLEQDWADELVLKLFFSIPVGAYLCGLVCGADRVTETSLNRQKNGIQSFFTQIRHVPNAVWMIVVCVFVVFYLIFLGFQSSYFFGAFRRMLPEDFTVAEYARQGFFELCKILALNFALFWLVCCSAVRTVREDRPVKLVSSVLLVESILFAVTALSKLILYIDCFGFTPLRLKSFWLVCVLLMGCILSLVSLWSKKSTIRIWIFFTGISLALLHLY